MNSVPLITDFHSHILPNMDDGSKSAEMSLKMLDMIAEQGILSVVATPHFYPMSESVSGFLERRNRAVQSLISIYDKNRHPSVYIGAEVAFYHGISNAEQLYKLCIEGTRYLLLEMPFSRWDNDTVGEVFAIKDELDICPIIAHIERYSAFCRHSVISSFIESGILIQSNASFFIDKKTSKKALKMLKKGEINLLGSDSHNLSDRKPNLGSAIRFILQSGLTVELNNVASLGKELLSL